MKKPALISFVFAGVFIMGAVAGAFIAARFMAEVPYQRSTDIFADQQFKRVAEMLELTPEQRGRIQPIVTQAAKEVQARRLDVRATFDRMHEEFRKELTNEQRSQYDEWRKRQHDAERRFQRWAREQRPLHPEFSGDAPAPAEKPGEKAGEKPAVPVPASQPAR